MDYNLTGKTAGYFDAFKNIIDNIVAAVKEFYDVIKKFVDGFQKEITVNPEEPDPMY